MRRIEGLRADEAETFEVDGGEWDAVDALSVEEGDQVEVHWAEWPSWMRGSLQRGRAEREREGADGAEWNHQDEVPPEE